MLRKVRSAVADAAETLRRAFAGLGVKELPLDPFQPRDHGLPAFAPVTGGGLPECQATGRTEPLLGAPVRCGAMALPVARLHAEAGWGERGAHARVVDMPTLEAAGTVGLAVPTLPRSLPTRSQLEGLPGARTRVLGHTLPRPGVRHQAPALPGTRGRRLEARLARSQVLQGLDLALALPVPFQALDIQRLAKGLWMRYSLQLVRSTGQNVRNLEVLGLFYLPRKGVAELHHDPRRGRLLVQLSLAALGSPKAPFILARRRDDGSLVTCFVEGA